MDIKDRRADFPVFEQQVHGKNIVYLDSAASSQMPKQVVDRLQHYHLYEHANVHRGIHTLSQNATVAYEQTRKKLKDLIGAGFEEEVIFTHGATESINMVAYSYGLNFLKEGDEILITELEHHANIVPWQMIAEKVGATVKAVAMLDDGSLDMNNYKELLSDKTAIVAVAHISNVTGVNIPVKEIAALAHQKDALVLVDGCQAVPHTKVDVQDIDADFYVFSAHKMYGPTGIGVLYGKKDLLEKMPPFLGGGSMIDKVTVEKTTYNDLPHKLEAGTPPIAAGIGFSAAIDYINELGLENIEKREHEILEYATEKLSEIDGVRIFGTNKDKCAVISFAVDDIHPHDLGTILDQSGVAIRTGHHCAQLLMQHYKVPATARASFAFYNNEDDVDALVKAIYQAKEIFS